MNTTTRHLLATVDGGDLRVSLMWDARDPYAVRMDVHAVNTVRWEFGWDLLAEGLRHPVAPEAGDVHIRPAGDRTEIVLMPGAGQAVLSVPTGELVAFLADTWCALPPVIPDFIPFDLDGEAAS